MAVNEKKEHKASGLKRFVCSQTKRSSQEIRFVLDVSSVKLKEDEFEF